MKSFKRNYYVYGVKRSDYVSQISKKNPKEKRREQRKESRIKKKKNHDKTSNISRCRPIVYILLP